MNRRSIIKAGALAVASFFARKTNAGINIPEKPKPIEAPKEIKSSFDGDVIVFDVDRKPADHHEAFNKAGIHLVIAEDAQMLLKFGSKPHAKYDAAYLNCTLSSDMFSFLQNRKVFVTTPNMNRETLREILVLAYENNLAITIGHVTKSIVKGLTPSSIHFMASTITMIEKMDQDGWMLCSNLKSRWLPNERFVF